MKVGLLGKKLGMTRVYDEKGRATAVTVVLAGGNVVIQRKTGVKDGYEAVKVGFDDQKPAIGEGTARAVFESVSRAEKASERV